MLSCHFPHDAFSLLCLVQHSDIFLLYLLSVKHGLELFGYVFAFCHEHEARGVHVEAVGQDIVSIYTSQI